MGLVLAAMMLTASDALADVRITAESTFPRETQVGQENLQFRFTAENISTDPDRDARLRLDEAGINPACGEYQGGVCVEPELEVFELETGPAAAVGVEGSCEGVTFTVSEPDAQGRHSIIPNEEVILGPSDGSGEPRFCTWEMTIERVNRTPDNDARPEQPGIQTENRIDVRATDPATGRTTDFGRTDLVTILPGEVTLETRADPNMVDDPMPVPPGTTSTDTATVRPTNPNAIEPTGDVFFQLIGPDPAADCTGPVAFESGPHPIDPATGMAVSEESPPLEDPGLYNWVATFESGDNNYADIEQPQGCGDDRERFIVQPAPEIDVVKTVDPETRPEPGGTFTYTVEVTNTGPNAITITSLVDDVYGDLADPDNPNVENSTCTEAVGTVLQPGESFTCTFDAEFTGVAGDEETDTVTVTGEDEFGQEAQAEDDATITLTPPPDITVEIEKTVDPASLPEPGGDFTFDVVVTNTTERAVTITSLTDDVYGDLNDPDNPEVTDNTCTDAVGTTLAASPGPGNTYECSFVGEFIGEAGDTETDTVTVVVQDEQGREADAEDDATVEITPAPGDLTIQVVKTADPTSLPEPGGTFTFTVEVTNTSDRRLAITSLTDDVYGDLNDPDNPEVDNNTCAGVVGTVLDPDETFTCTFDGEFTGEAGDTETDTVTVVGEDEDGREVTDDDDATVEITPPPGEPAVRVDKTADPESLPAPGGDFTFTVVITNTSADRAVTITSLTDDVYGDLNDPDNPNVADNTCAGLVGTRLELNELTTCTFVGEFTGEAGDTETDVVTVVVRDDEGRQAVDDDDAVVVLTGEEPAPRDDEKEEPPPVKPVQALPRTGGDVMLAVVVGAAMLLLGLMMVRAAPAGTLLPHGRVRPRRMRP